MKRIEVKSSNVASIGHEGETLEVQFHGGGTYQYDGVPTSEYEALMAATSKGQYLNKHIQKTYPFRKVG